MASVIERGLSNSQVKALASVPDHDDVELPRTRSTVDASVYLDPARFAAERAAIFRQKPVPLTLSAALPAAGMFLAHRDFGLPVLVTRARDGQVRAFVNVCRHRGTLLCEQSGVQKGGRVVCPYHAWTYGLDGALLGVPQAATFPGLDKADFALTPLPCLESQGVIWVQLTPGEEGDFSGVTGALADDLATFGLADMHLYRQRSYTVDANWKLVMDAFMENYHVLRLHSDSVAQFFVDAPQVIDRIGDHIRMMQGRANFDKGAADHRFERVRHTMSFAYNLFPGAILITSPVYVSFMVMMPQAYDRTRIDYYMLSDRAPTNEKEEDRLDRSFTLMNKVFGEEDFRAAWLAQQGLEARTLDKLELGGFEQPIRMFHDVIDSYL